MWGYAYQQKLRYNWLVQIIPYKYIIKSRPYVMVMKSVRFVCFVVAAQCIHTPTLRRTGYAVDYVRLGEWDLRSENDCEEVSSCSSHPIFQSEIF